MIDPELEKVLQSLEQSGIEEELAVARLIRDSIAKWDASGGDSIVFANVVLRGLSNTVRKVRKVTEKT